MYKETNMFTVLNHINTPLTVKLSFNNNLQQPITPIINEDIILPAKHKWVVWIRLSSNTNWSLESYQKVGSIETLNDMFKFIYSLSLLNPSLYQIFIMKENILPIWEDPLNRSGGTCSFKININNGINFFEDIILHLINEDIFIDSDEINGISYSTKNNWTIIKLWNRDNRSIISKSLKPKFQQKYSHLHMRYKKNSPEY